MTVMRRYMHLIESMVVEMPVVDYQTHGDFTTPGSFGNSGSDPKPVDTKIVTSPKFIEKVKRVFAKSPVNIIMHVANLQTAGDEEDEEWYYDQWMTRTAKAGHDHYTPWTASRLKRETGLRIAPTSGAITIVYLGNATGGDVAQDDQLQMSPWILAHRLGHATGGRLELPLAEAVEPVLQQIGDLIGKDIAGVANTIMTMKSARDEKITQDFANELIAQFIIQGKVVFRPTGLAAADVLISRLASSVNRMIETGLTAMVGKLLVF